ncbi:MAG: hypothetical protein U0694_28290 [Anaerolineae bacterium]
MDRGVDALQAYREFLGYVQRTPHPLYSVVALNNLGYEYIMAQRYDQAPPLLETGAKNFISTCNRTFIIPSRSCIWSRMFSQNACVN